MRATHNQFITGLVPAFSALLRVSFRLSVSSRDSAKRSLPAHKRLLDAIATRDVRAAERANAGSSNRRAPTSKSRIGSGPPDARGSRA